MELHAPSDARKIISNHPTMAGRQIGYDNYFGRKDRLEPGPQGFLVNFPAETVGPPHFHEENQFQVFFGVPGARYGSRAMPDLMVHYADAHTPYGPFSTLGTPMVFYTLRATATLATRYIPQERHALRREGLHRNLFARPELRPLPAEECATELLFHAKEDAARAELLTAGPRARVRMSGSEGAGSYYCIVQGEVMLNGRTYPRLSLGWIDAGDPPFELVAGSEGCTVVIMQFPEENRSRA